MLIRSGYGPANEEWAIPNTPETRFRIGSVTKTFTAAAILQVAEAGAIDLHGEISRWLDDLPHPGGGSRSISF